ncbi:hypothetical protein DFQ27_002461 [Actinomortierella ambigua]|uniref:G-protein coupled receptors family 2 profile 2 domain-containing protein n=1 Tax=Actinomortierella ambigua TaxID=1343610 RepID=A0A9P6QAV8_9FUNG|nr:hypothetical protein DFQ27_002461 [Actinomortierella ambigua]
MLNVIISSMRVVSCTVTLVLAISYLVLPGRRQHPHLIILCMFVTTVLWEGVGIVWLFRRRSLTCHSEVEEATMTNSTICGIQGILLVYLVGVLFIQGITLIVNLHSLIVYRSSRVQHHVSKMICLSFVLPLALVVVPAVKREYEFSGYGSICFMSSEYVNSYFFYPVGAMMAFGVLVHLTTVLYMIKTYVTSGQDWSGATTSASLPSAEGNPGLSSSSISGTNSQLSKRQKRVQTARDISRLLKQQWRPGAFALCQLVIYLVYFGFYFIEIQKFDRIQATSEWFQHWSTCLAQQTVQNILQLGRSSSPDAGLTASSLLEPLILNQLGQDGQRACVLMAKDNVPQFWKLCLSDAAPTVFGICIFFIFGSKYELWQDWKRFFWETVLRRKGFMGPPDQVDTFQMVQKRSAGADKPTGGGKGGKGGGGGYGDDAEGDGDHEDHDFNYIAMKEGKGSLQLVLPSISSPPPFSAHQGIEIYPQMLTSADVTALANNGSSSRSGSRANMVTTAEDDLEACYRYSPYRRPVPPAQISFVSHGDGSPTAAQAARHASGNIKRSVSFQQEPTIISGGPLVVPLTMSPPPIPLPWSTYGGPSPRRSTKKLDSPQQSQARRKEEPKELTLASALMHSEQPQQRGIHFYKDLESMSESESQPPTSTGTPSSFPPSPLMPIFDPILYYTFSLPPTPDPPATPDMTIALALQRAEQDLLREQQEKRARKVLDGSEPWPSWPSSPTATPTAEDMIGMDLCPSTIIKGHRVRKQLSAFMEMPPSFKATTTVTSTATTTTATPTTTTIFSSNFGGDDHYEHYNANNIYNNSDYSGNSRHESRPWTPITTPTPSTPTTTTANHQGWPMMFGSNSSNSNSVSTSNINNNSINKDGDGNDDDDEEEQERIQRRNQLRPSPLSMAGPTSIASATSHSSPLSTTSPKLPGLSPRSPAPVSSPRNPTPVSPRSPAPVSPRSPVPVSPRLPTPISPRSPARVLPRSPEPVSPRSLAPSSPPLPSIPPRSKSRPSPAHS